MDESCDERTVILPVPVASSQTQRWKRRFRVVASLGGIGLLCCSGLALLSSFRPPPARSLTGPFWSSLWSMRSGLERHKQAVVAECVIDSSLGATYLARMGLELNEVSILCPEVKTLGKESFDVYVEAVAKLHELTLTRPARAQAEAAMRRAQDLLSQVPGWHRHVADAKRNATGGAPRNASAASPPSPDGSDSRHGEGHAAAAPAAAARSAELGRSHAGSAERGANASDRAGGDAPEEDPKALVEEVLAQFREVSVLRKRAEVKNRLCVAASAGAFSSFAYAFSYVAAVTTECPGLHRRSEYCAADITRMLGSLAEMAAGAAAISAQCTADAKYIDDDAAVEDRRLTASGDMFAGLFKRRSEFRTQKEERESLQAACSIDVVQAAAFLSRSGTELVAIVEHCSTNRHDNYCGATISGLFAAFSMTSMLLSDIVVECPGRLDLGAICTSSISQLVGGIAELSGAAWALAETCVTDDFQTKEEDIEKNE
mmetsp:Transcript_91555/g.262223  ORF Transcript_91555/g.262223 Transcript_91555/m.262223 type:complete len:488 (-) Transcript_91555:399-1862(-)